MATRTRDIAEKREALMNPDTLTTVLNAILKSMYGDDFYDWDIVTIYLELRADFGVEVPQEIVDKIGALQMFMTTDAFFKRIEGFHSACNTLATGTPFFTVFDPVTTEEAAWAVTEVAFNRDMLPFSHAVRSYLKEILKRDGYDVYANGTTDDLPGNLNEVFDKLPSQSDILKHLDDVRAAKHNLNNTDAYIDEQLQDMIYQFNKIPSLSNMDDILMRTDKNERTDTED